MDDDEIDDLFSFSTATKSPGKNVTDRKTLDIEEFLAEDENDDALGKLTSSSITVKTGHVEKSKKAPLSQSSIDEDSSLEFRDSATEDILNWLDAGKTSTCKDISHTPKAEKEIIAIDSDELELTPSAPPGSKPALKTSSFDFEKDILGDDAAEEELNITEEDKPQPVENVEEQASEVSVYSPTIVKIPDSDSVQSKSQENAILKDETTKEIEFDTLREALAADAPSCSLQELVRIVRKENFKVSEEDRSMLWCKLITGRDISTIESSNMAEKFDTWKLSTNINKELDQHLLDLIEETSKSLKNNEQTKNDLVSLLQYHYHTTKSAWDELLPSIISALLQVFSVNATLVIQSRYLFPKYMPLMALNLTERLPAVTTLYSHFYLLSTYHLPTLILHLDRHVPSWYTSKIPFSWCLSLFTTNHIHSDYIVHLWDILLTAKDSDPSIVFFFALAFIQRHSEALLLSSNPTELGEKLENVFNNPFHETEDEKSYEQVHSCYQSALAFVQLTPKSILTTLKSIEDNAMTKVLKHRQSITEARLQKLEQEEKKKKEEEAERNYVKPKLIAFYEKYNPDKLSTVDDVLEVFKGRYGELNDKLISKYGYGYRSFGALGGRFSYMSERKFWSTKPKSSENEGLIEDTNETAINEINNSSGLVAAQINPEEVFPVLFQSHTKPFLKGIETPTSGLQFYLVDSRPLDIASRQGRFPTSASIPPSSLQDSDSIAKQLDTFESLRGAVHIVILGEGIEALPSLYVHYELSAAQKDIAREDASRTSLCALFFIKRGFPFVSILKDGFAGAYTYLSRTSLFSSSSVNNLLVDYDPKTSSLAALENAYQEQIRYDQANAKEKTVIALQNFMDNSMVTLTVTQQKIENYAMEEGKSEKIRTSVGKLLSSVRSSKQDDVGDESNDLMLQHEVGNNEDPDVTIANLEESNAASASLNSSRITSFFKRSQTLSTPITSPSSSVDTSNASVSPESRSLRFWKRPAFSATVVEPETSNTSLEGGDSTKSAEEKNLIEEDEPKTGGDPRLAAMSFWRRSFDVPIAAVESVASVDKDNSVKEEKSTDDSSKEAESSSSSLTDSTYFSMFSRIKLRSDKLPDEANSQENDVSIRSKDYSESEEVIHLSDGDNEEQETEDKITPNIVVNALFPPTNTENKSNNYGGIKSIASTPVFLEDLGEILVNDSNEDKKDDVTTDSTVATSDSEIKSA